MRFREVFCRVLLSALIILIQSLPAKAFPVRINTTDDLIMRLRQTVQEQYQIPAQSVLIIWNDDTLEEKLIPWGRHSAVELTEQDLLNLIRKTTLTLRVVEGNKFRTLLPVSLKVDGWLDVCTLRHAVRQGELLSEDKIQTTRKKLSDLPMGYLKSLEYPSEFKANRNLAAGIILNPAMLEQVPLVVKGTPVRVMVLSGNLRLVAQGEVLENGVRNQAVSVKVISFGSNRMIKARVTGPGEVTLEMKQDK